MNILYDAILPPSNRASTLQESQIPCLIAEEIRGLVVLLNQLEDITLVRIWRTAWDAEEHPEIGPRITLHCPTDTATGLLSDIAAVEGIGIEVLPSEHVDDTVWCTLSFELCMSQKPFRYLSIPEMEDRLATVLNRQGPSTDNSFHRGNAEWKVYQWPSGIPRMDSSKLQHLKQWVNDSSGERLRHLKGLDTWTQTVLEGFSYVWASSEYEGHCHYENHANLGDFAALDVVWQAWSMKLFLTQHDGRTIQVSSLSDVQAISPDWAELLAPLLD